MINFRFHLVSLIAVFLALAVGIVVGSTVIDQAIVDGLRDQIDRVEAKADARKIENDGLKDELDRVAGYVEASAMFAVEERLPGVPVVVLAERGVDAGVVDATLELIRAAGGDAPSVVWLDPAWRLEGEPERDALGDLVGRVGDPEALRAKGFAALASWVAGPADEEAGASDDPGTDTGPATTSTTDASSTSTGTTVTADGALVTELAAAGLLAVDGGDVPESFPGPGARVLLITGSGSELATAKALTEALVAAGVPTVVAEVYASTDGGPDRGGSLAEILADDALSSAVTTVDDLELVEGRVSAVIGLAELADGTVGHYGYGSGATRSLPEWTAR